MPVSVCMLAAETDADYFTEGICLTCAGGYMVQAAVSTRYVFDLQVLLCTCYCIVPASSQ
jgi:hypothetical protein